MKQFYLYSATTNSFYPVSAPEDAVQITEEKHTELFDGQSEGKSIKPNKSGYPINVEQGKSYEVWDRESESWVIDDELLAQEVEAEKKAEADATQAERAKLMQEMQYHMLLGEEDKAREIALKIKELSEYDQTGNDTLLSS